MEEIKIKKKLNKKPLIICLALAIVFGIIGFMDIKSNATELYTVNLKLHQTVYELDGVTLRQELVLAERTLTSSSPIYVYYYEVEEPTTGRKDVVVYPISQSNISGESNGTRTMTDVDGNTWYYNWSLGWSTGNDNFLFSHTFEIEGAEKTYKITNPNMVLDFPTYFSNGTLEYIQDIDYDNLSIDDDMPVVSDILRNYIINHYATPGEEGITQPSDTYEYLTWVNNSDLPIQIEVIPVVQIYKTLFGKSDYLEEYVGEWRDFELLESGTTKYMRQTDDASLLEKYNEDYQFKETCEFERGINVFTETSYFFYGYRIRYVDAENEKVGPWVVVMPSKVVNESSTWIEYQNGVVGNSSSSTGELSDTNYGDVEKNLEEIDETIKFKDKYDVVDSNANTQEVMNWLNTVVSFIKGTPSIVTSVLSFLPQPILYGMYITIFLGCIASAIAIVKALI